MVSVYPLPGKDTLAKNDNRKPVTEGTIHLWTAKLDLWKSYIGKLRGLLSSEELDRLDRLKIESKREEFLWSRGILRIVLAQYEKEEPQHLIICRSPGGKPFLPESRLEFNISHSSGLLICGIRSKQRIGVDIQEIYPVSSLDRIIQNHFSPTEIEYLQGLPTGADYYSYFFAIWTAKEAYFKGIGIGINDNFNQVSIIPESGDIRSYHLTGSNFLAEHSDWTIQPLKIAERFSAAVAYEGQLSGLYWNELSPDDW